MRRWFLPAILAALLWPYPILSPAQQAFPDEAAVVAETEALIERTPAPDEKTRKKVRDLIRKGIDDYDQVRYEKALASFEKALRLDPVSDVAYYEAAMAYNALGRLPEALDAVLRAMVINPKAEMYRVFRASLLDDLGDREAAVAAYRELLDLQPDSYMGRLNLGLTLTRMQRWEEAEAEYLRAIEIDPDYPSAYFHMSILCRDLGYAYDEERYLEKFLEVGAGDRRAETARRRLEELRSQNVLVAEDHPYPAVDLVEKLMRASWRSQLHRMTFPDARGYALTFEEDRAVYDAVLESWREEKSGDPGAAYGPYDLLLRIDEAGFMEEYIWYHRQRVFGERAERWMEEHPQRMEAFLSWARAEGLLSEEEPAPEPTILDQFRALPAELYRIMDESEVGYELSLEPERAHGLLEDEASRFSRGLRLEGESRVACGKAARDLDEAIGAVGARALLPGLRCWLPGSEEYGMLAARAGRLGLELDEVQFRPVAEIESGESVKIATAPDWLAYALAKGAWRHEPGLRREYGVEDGDTPVLAEEMYAVAVTVGAYANSLDPDAAEPPTRLPALDRLLAAMERGAFRGYVLYEVIHKAYGIPLDRLSEGDAEELSDYIFGHVVVRTRAGKDGGA